MSSTQRVFLIFGLFFIAMQFISIDIHAKQTNSDEINIDNPAKDIFEKHCFDCHSNQTKVPFYGNIAPISWIVQKDVRDARATLNFSQWQDYNDTKKLEFRKEIYRAVSMAMPPQLYTLAHGNLTADEKDTIQKWCDLTTEQQRER